MRLKNGILYLFTAFLLVFLTFSTCAQDKKHDKKVHWGYEGDIGPAHWGELSPEFAGCSKGTAQTPIDINSTFLTNLPAIKISFKEDGLKIINNGHTVQVNLSPGSSSVFKGEKYSLLQFHFHTPSEHTVKGKHYPMEAHLVHKNGKGELAVIGVFFKEGKANKLLQKIIDNFPAEEGKVFENNSVKIDAAELLPAQRGYYHYYGSLTTPPCTEGVSWFVMKAPLEASKAQIEAFEKIMHKNNRPVLPLNKRFVLESE